MDGVEGILDMVRSSGNMYLKAEEQDGTEKLTLLVLDGKAYQMDSARKLAICLGDEAAAYKAMGLSETVVAKSLSTGSATGFRLPSGRRRQRPKSRLLSAGSLLLRA